MDPLAGSALSILEDGGGLPLVLDRLNEDDALCAALACTTLRDVLFAQARHVVRAAGKPYAGKRIVTSVAGVASSAGRLAWVRGLSGVVPSWVRAWDWRTSLHLASVGALHEDIVDKVASHRLLYLHSCKACASEACASM